ncbi:hypothetical protein CLF_101704 [Clonorchis sinensis]|uniref:Uncharacterized protein n=1 Tax=Clonorchis sinensis TaxID=79923 RepID=G7Y6D2_CLOSI|nr:hypothetical protein CLF_101704 [Clonorchis sinensis]
MAIPDWACTTHLRVTYNQWASWSTLPAAILYVLSSKDLAKFISHKLPHFTRRRSTPQWGPASAIVSSDSRRFTRNRSILGDRKIQDALFKQLFLKRLATQVQSILAPDTYEVPWMQLAKLVDGILEIRTCSPKLNSLDSSTAILSLYSRSNELAKQIAMYYTCTTHNARYACHNGVARELSKYLRRLGYTVFEESTSFTKPGLIIVWELRATAIDASIISDERSDCVE